MLVGMPARPGRTFAPLIAALIVAAGLGCGSAKGGADGGSGGSGLGGTSGGAGGAAGAPDAGAIACALDGGQCPSGTRCGCGGPGVGVCTCHKECTSTGDCPSTEPMCGCTSSDPAPRICVNSCFCLCG
jgi:hypothetical protein